MTPPGLTPAQDRSVRLAAQAARYLSQRNTAQRQLEDAEFLIRCLARDWADRCDHPDDCSCSMAQAIRYDRERCPHVSWTGIDQTPIGDPGKVWQCDGCGLRRAEADR